MIPRRPALPTTAVLLLAAGAGAVDTAFWEEYRADPADRDLFLQMAFEAGALLDAAGPVASVEMVGDAAPEPAGRFGGALRLGGRGALKVVPASVFPGGHISIEAWIRLDHLPDATAAIVFRPAVVDGDARYDPARDTTKGFALCVGPEGQLVLETRNCFYGSLTRTASPAGAVPAGRWVHVAGVSAVFPVGMRRLFVDGREVARAPLAWGQGLVVGGDEETVAGPLYIGNDDRGGAGLAGAIDALRIHRRVFRFQPRDDAWTDPAGDRPVPSGPPHFCADHSPALRLPLDGDLGPAAAPAIEGIRIEAEEGRFVPGVRGRAWRGRLAVAAPRILGLDGGAIEFWFQPAGWNSCSDRNVVIVETNGFIYYLLNSENPNGVPLTLYFDKGDGGGLHFVGDRTGTLCFPGTWRHAIVSWKGKDIVLYLDGREAGRSCGEPLARPGGRGVLDRIVFMPHGAGIVDEVFLYDRPLLPEEASNAHARYRDPGKLRGVRLPWVEVKGQYHPYADRLHTLVEPNVPADRIARVRLSLRDAAGKVLFADESPLVLDERAFSLPALPDGTYALAAAAFGHDGAEEPGTSFTFVRKRFSWERNRIGITGEVFPPFTPIETSGASVRVVGRTLVLNGFGLWSEVVTRGRDILAGPMTIRFETAGGEGTWTRSGGSWRSAAPALAVHEALAEAGPVAVRTVSSIEVDGCMKVEMDLLPGPRPEEIRRLWIEIPLKAAEARLFHAIADGLRQNPAGSIPAGDGPVWDGSKAVRSRDWRNAFVPYVWLGGEERGLAWFGENDRGWVTEKGRRRVHIQEIRRDGDRVVLRVYLVNRTVTLDAARRLVFGLQASPTKPMAEGWRRKLPDCPGGLAVVPWGGLQCASQGPHRDDWRIVDEILRCRAGKDLDREWFEDYAAEHGPPLVHGNWDWLGSIEHFAGNVRRAGPGRPVAVYQEEMFASTARPEWAVFQDEWGAGDDGWARREPPPEGLDGGYASIGDSAAVTYGESYRDFGTWFANEWLRRGVSLYWDNVFPKLATNRRTTDAYLAEDGGIQPALLIWSQREYGKRVWHALQEWRRRRPEPLEWTLHMTNTCVLPILTWGTIDLDHELGSDRPFAPDWLRAETIGLQVGNSPLSLYPVTGDRNAVFAALRKVRTKGEVDRLVERAEWGMRAVHEIARSGPLEERILRFGYGDDGACAVRNYWADEPALAVSRDEVKWIVLERRDRREVLAVLASWSEEDVECEVRLLPGGMGIDPAGMRLVDDETGESVPAGAGGEARILFTGPYGVRILRFRR